MELLTKVGRSSTSLTKESYHAPFNVCSNRLFGRLRMCFRHSLGSSHHHDLRYAAINDNDCRRSSRCPNTGRYEHDHDNPQNDDLLSDLHDGNSG
jgi:hypothetical protein